jgi:hypothetical protein
MRDRKKTQATKFNDAKFAALLVERKWIVSCGIAYFSFHAFRALNHGRT